MADRDDNWFLQLLASVGAAVAVIGVGVLVVGGAALGAASLFGLTGGQEPAAEPSLYMPPLQKPTPSGEPVRSQPTPTPGATPSAPVQPSPTNTAPSKEPKKKSGARRGLVLTARPSTASPMERIYLSGRYPGQDGSTLQVQRFQGGWTDFPVTTSVSGGQYSTYVQTGNTGQNRFRVLDTSTGRASNPVTVTVG